MASKEKSGSSVSMEQKSNTGKDSMGSGWISIPDWLSLLKIFIVIGVTIFGIGQLANTPDTDLAAYIWFGIGILVTWILALRLISIQYKKNNKKGSWFSALSNASLMLPTLSTLLPICVLIGIMAKVKPILDTKADLLPKQYFWFNHLTFFLVVLQMFLLYKFYSSNIEVFKTGKGETNKYKGVWTGALILVSVLTSAAAIELYVIITSFITDG